jgi:G3E family GTPase
MIARAAAGVPAVVIGGYLGAGKTTLVNELLRQADGQRIAVLVNDFGELAIDADLVVGASGDVLALAGGCVCCSFGADLIGTLRQVLQRTPMPDRVLIECSGVGLPAAVARSVRLLPQIDLHGIVTVLDASNVQQRTADPYVGDTVRGQIAQAQRLVLNKIDLVASQRRAGLHQRIDDMARGVPMLEATQGALPSEWVWAASPAVSPAAPPAASGPRPAQRVAIDVFRSECRRLDGPVDPATLCTELRAEGDALLRVKGWFTRPDGRRCLLQGVGPVLQVTAVAPGTATGGDDRLLLIRRAPGPPAGASPTMAV